MEQRECPYCQQRKDNTQANFYNDRTMCKECVSKRRKERYREANKEIISEQQKQYYEMNKEAIAERKKQYREANKEKIKEQDKLKRQENVTCECGAILRKYSLARHLKHPTAQHENYIMLKTKAEKEAEKAAKRRQQREAKQREAKQ